MKRVALLCFVLGAFGCSHDADGLIAPDGGGGDPPASSPDLAGAPTAPTTPSPDLAKPPTSAPDLAPPVELGPPLEAPRNEWTWIDVDGMKCGNGSSSGIGVNLTDESDDVLIFLEGGGACWDGYTCWGPPGTALYLQTGYNALAFATDPQRILYFLNRGDDGNPFRKKNLIYIPYCTGDAFAGDNVINLSWFGDHETHFVGYRNVGIALSRIVATLPSAKRVWLAGDSAGGFGAAFNFGRVQTAFPKARVDVIDDSGQPIMPNAARWQIWKALWNIQMPSDCTKCDDGPGAFVDYYRGKYPNSRFGLISFDYDIVIAPFMNLSLDDFHQQLLALASEIDASWANARYFILPGASHVGIALPTPGLRAWITKMVEDDPTWSSSQP